VYADGDALCAGGVIISCQSPLMTLVETALGVKASGWAGITRPARNFSETHEGESG